MIVDTVAISEYRKRRQARLNARLHHREDAEPAAEENNGPNNPPPASGGSGGHGNTRLPFGLCKRYGIDIDSSWRPRDAWDALAEKGVSPSGEYRKLGEKRQQQKSGTVRSSSGTVYSNLKARKASNGEYELLGDFEYEPVKGVTKRYTGAKYSSFLTKEEMYSCLRENGVRRFQDPDTGEIVNPQKMDLPRTVAKVGERRYTDIVLGTRTHRGGDLYARRGFSITGKDFAGHRTVLKWFSTVEEAKRYSEKIGCKPEDLRISKDVKGYASPTIKEETKRK